MFLHTSCKELAWVPFQPDLYPEFDETDLWGFCSVHLPANDQNIPLLPGNIEFIHFADLSTNTSQQDHGCYLNILLLTIINILTSYYITIMYIIF